MTIIDSPAFRKLEELKAEHRAREVEEQEARSKLRSSARDVERRQVELAEYEAAVERGDEKPSVKKRSDLLARVNEAKAFAVVTDESHPARPQYGDARLQRKLAEARDATTEAQQAIYHYISDHRAELEPDLLAAAHEARENLEEALAVADRAVGRWQSIRALFIREDFGQRWGYAPADIQPLAMDAPSKILAEGELQRERSFGIPRDKHNRTPAPRRLLDKEAKRPSDGVEMRKATADDAWAARNRSEERRQQLAASLRGSGLSVEDVEKAMAAEGDRITRESRTAA